MIFRYRHEHHHYHHYDDEEICRIMRPINRALEKIMSDVAAILAKATANNDMLKSQRIVIDGLNEGMVSIADLITDLKAQIAAGQAPDLAPLEAALDEQKELIEGANEAIGANLKPSQM